MTFKFQCPHCAQRISATSADIGAEAHCPSCDKTIIVPTSPLRTPLYGTKGKPPKEEEPETVPLTTSERLDHLLGGSVVFSVGIFILWVVMATWFPGTFMSNGIINPQPFASEFPNPPTANGEVCWLPGCNRPAPRLHYEDIQVGTRYYPHSLNQPKRCHLHEEHTLFIWPLVFCWLNFEIAGIGALCCYLFFVVGGLILTTVGGDRLHSAVTGVVSRKASERARKTSNRAGEYEAFRRNK